MIIHDAEESALCRVRCESSLSIVAVCGVRAVKVYCNALCGKSYGVSLEVTDASWSILHRERRPRVVYCQTESRTTVISSTLLPAGIRYTSRYPNCASVLFTPISCTICNEVCQVPGSKRKTRRSEVTSCTLKPHGTVV